MWRPLSTLLLNVKFSLAAINCASLGNVIGRIVIQFVGNVGDLKNWYRRCWSWRWCDLNFTQSSFVMLFGWRAYEEQCLQLTAFCSIWRQSRYPSLVSVSEGFFANCRKCIPESWVDQNRQLLDDQNDISRINWWLNSVLNSIWINFHKNWWYEIL